MKTSWLSLINALTMGTLILSTACQEKVAPELSSAGASAGSTTTSGSGGGAAATHNFTLTLGETPTAGTDASKLNYQIHKVNDLVSSSCKVEDVLDVPDVLDATRDITCFVEAEEWALYYNGIGFDISSDAETCDYIIYQPYYFQQFQPGLTARQTGKPRVMLAFTCDADATGVLGAQPIPSGAGSFGANASAYTTANDLCGKVFNIVDDGSSEEWGELDLTATDTPVVRQDTMQKYCSFDHGRFGQLSSEAAKPNCDEGSIHLFVANITTTDTDADNVVDTLLVANSVIEHQCGGNFRSCSAGPMVDELKDSYINNGFTLRFTQTGEEATSVNYNVPSPYSKELKTNQSIANFTRQCSGVSLWNTDASFTASANSYNPDIIAEYAELGTDTSLTQEQIDGMDVIILGDDPFRAGLDPSYAAANNLSKYDTTELSAQPHYQFVCLDKAFDIKARIRVAVREWNKNFNIATTSLAYVSDVYKDGLTTAQMDATNIQTVPYGPYINYNDRKDWDDFLRWDDTGGTASCTTSFMDDGDGNAATDPTRSQVWFPGLSL